MRRFLSANASAISKFEERRFHNLQGRIAFVTLITSHWWCHTFAPDRIPTPLVRVNNQPARRLISAPKWACVQHLEAITGSAIFSLSVRL
ncbi:hypothetical protein TNCV_3793641 [Trichonephila clavipes]|nr:hypothetical protein TNCV_3793641 [Trichonephila clavipes]